MRLPGPVVSAPAVEHVVPVVLITPLFILAVAVHMAMDHSLVGFASGGKAEWDLLGKIRFSIHFQPVYGDSDCGSRNNLELFGK